MLSHEGRVHRHENRQPDSNPKLNPTLSGGPQLHGVRSMGSSAAWCNPSTSICRGSRSTWSSTPRPPSHGTTPSDEPAVGIKYPRKVGSDGPHWRCARTLKPCNIVVSECRACEPVQTHERLKKTRGFKNTFCVSLLRSLFSSSCAAEDGTRQRASSRSASGAQSPHSTHSTSHTVW